MLQFVFKPIKNKMKIFFLLVITLALLASVLTAPQRSTRKSFAARIAELNARAASRRAAGAARRAARKSTRATRPFTFKPIV